MDKKKLEDIKEIIKILNEDTITKKEFAQLVSNLAMQFKSLKEDLKLDYISAENKLKNILNTANNDYLKNKENIQ